MARTHPQRSTHAIRRLLFDCVSAGVSELHGTAIADVDGDGIPDFIVGKRFWSHLDDYFDSDPYGPAVLYWFKTVRNSKAPGGARLTIDKLAGRLRWIFCKHCRLIYKVRV
jgi:hypothetical protein